MRTNRKRNRQAVVCHLSRGALLAVIMAPLKRAVGL